MKHLVKETVKEVMFKERSNSLGPSFNKISLAN